MSSSVDSQKKKDKVKQLRRDAENGEWSIVNQAHKQESTLRSVEIMEIGDTVSSLEKLRSDAMKGNWSDVCETYKQERALRMDKITPTGDTVLHMAVSNWEVDLVEDMVDFLVQEEKSLTQDNVVVTVDGGGGDESSWNKNIFLGVENDRKDTPLHLAGAMGSDWICKKIGGTDPSLIARRNINGETPLFLAALNGCRRTFLWLHYLYKVSPTDFAHCIRDNQDTILHCAIAEGHFDVAIEIVHLYKDHLKKMMRRNKEGLTPLHLLAAQRSAFKTTALLEVPRLFKSIYRLWKVEEKKKATTFEELQNFKYDTPGDGRFLRKFTKLVCFLPLRLPLFILLVLVLLLMSLQLLPEAAIERWYCNIPGMKERHTRCYQIMTKLLQHASGEDMSQVRSRSASKHFSDSLQSEEFNEPEAMEKPPPDITIETPLMIAVKHGVIEMVEKILELFPSTIKDVNGEGKNIFLLAAQYRQVEVYESLLRKTWLNESVFRHIDKKGNNALHLAAKHGEMDWFEFVKDTKPCAGLLGRYNRNMETPEETFRESHKELMKSEAEWVVKTSEACSVVSTLVVSVAFSTRTSVPGGYEGGNGYAVLRNNPSEFKTFRDSSFVALLFSLISTVSFLSIVAASRSQSAHHHSWRHVPSKFYCGVYFMFASFVCLWISFCAADFFMLHDHTHKLNKALPTYILLSMGFILMVILQLPTFFGPRLSRLWRKATSPIEYQGPITRIPRTNNKDTDLKNQN
ncbi:hypothetical protein K1719_017760 [Acacia pycnantha]|nr:hypothetical protein K1719_017760 [Acacia pycnantha]